MSSLYIAGPSAELERVRRTLARAREWGHAITLGRLGRLLTLTVEDP